MPEFPLATTRVQPRTPRPSDDRAPGDADLTVPRVDRVSRRVLLAHARGARLHLVYLCICVPSYLLISILRFAILPVFLTESQRARIINLNFPFCLFSGVTSRARILLGARRGRSVKPHGIG